MFEPILGLVLSLGLGLSLSAVAVDAAAAPKNDNVAIRQSSAPDWAWAGARFSWNDSHGDIYAIGNFTISIPSQPTQSSNTTCSVVSDIQYIYNVLKNPEPWSYNYCNCYIKQSDFFCNANITVPAADDMVENVPSSDATNSAPIKINEVLRSVYVTWWSAYPPLPNQGPNWFVLPTNTWQPKVKGDTISLTQWSG